MTMRTYNLWRPRNTFDLEIISRAVMRRLRAVPGASEAVIRSGSPTLLARANGDGHAEGEGGVLSLSKEAFS
jgi:hypothetical protein